MAVHCAVCGEEFLGAVNRCWRCGAKMALPVDQDLPPVRPRSMPAMDAELLTEPQSVSALPRDPDETVEGVPPVIYEAVIADGEHSSGPQHRPAAAGRRVGSPFAPHAAQPIGTAEPADLATAYAPRQPIYPTGAAAAGGAVAALVLGVTSLLCSFFTVGALFLAVIGLAVGIWGLSSERRGQAIIGLLLCCVALALSGFQAVVLLYELQYGIKPWEAGA